MPKRPPPDTYPDDLDNVAFRRYRPSLRPGVWLRFRESWRSVVLGLLLLAMVSAGLVGGLLLLPEPSVQYVVIVPTPSPTPIGDVFGDFPQTVTQNFLDLPARIDNSLSPGGQRGYRFLLGPGLTWSVSLLNRDGSVGNYTLALYNPDGVLIDLQTDGTLSFSAPMVAQYALLITAPEGGTYVLRIFPE